MGCTKWRPKEKEKRELNCMYTWHRFLKYLLLRVLHFFASYYFISLSPNSQNFRHMSEYIVMSLLTGRVVRQTFNFFSLLHFFCQWVVRLNCLFTQTRWAGESVVFLPSCTPLFFHIKNTFLLYEWLDSIWQNSFENCCNPWCVNQSFFWTDCKFSPKSIS